MIANKSSLRIGIVGATGFVGQSFLTLLHRDQLPISEMRLFASEDSKGKQIEFQSPLGEIKSTIQVLQNNCFNDLDIVFFSSGDSISKEWAPHAVAAGAWVIDNSAAWRMDAKTPLVVPEVNSHLIRHQKKPMIISNPNCSTIQLVVALKPLLDSFGLEDVKVSSYQSVSGAGLPGMIELENQTHEFTSQFLDGESVKHKSGDYLQKMNFINQLKSEAFAKPILFNCIPQIGSFDESGFCTEELKIVKETKKILDQPKLSVSATTVRVPSLISHSEAVWVKLSKFANEDEVYSALGQFPGLHLNANKNSYITSADASYQDPVFVSRVRRDLHDPNTWLMWVVADNVYKGAALNGLQIAKLLIEN